jgi:cytochrome P450
MREIARPEHRSDPYQLYARLRGSPVTKQDDGSYVVSTYPDITALLHDPRISSDAGNLPEPPAVRAAVPPFIVHDPPSHDELRRLAMRHFGPPGSPGLVNGVEPEIRDMLDRLLSDLDASAPVDVVDAYAYPLPVTVICRILGVPAADQENFHA